MEKKLNWKYELNKAEYSKGVTQTLTAKDKQGNTVEMPSLESTDREATVTLTADTEITLTSCVDGAEETSKTIKVFVPEDDGDYSYDPNGQYGARLEIECDGTYTNVAKNSIVNFVPAIQIFINQNAGEQTVIRDFVTDTNSTWCPYWCYYKIGDGNYVEQTVNTPISVTATEDTYVTFKVKFRVYNYESSYPVEEDGVMNWGTKDTDYAEYSVVYTQAITVSEEETDLFVVETDAAQTIDVPSDRTITIPYTATYNGETVAPTITIVDKYGNDLLTLFNDTENEGGCYEHGGRAKYDGSVITITYPTNWNTFFDYNPCETETYYIGFTYNDITIYKNVVFKVNQLNVVLDGDYTNLATDTVPVLKWKVMYGDTEITDAVPTKIYLYDGSNDVSGYLTDQFEKSMYLYDLWKAYYNTANYATSNWCQSVTYWKKVTTAKREFDFSKYIENCKELSNWEFPKDFSFNIAVYYKNQWVYLSDSVVYDKNFDAVNKAAKVTFSNVANTLALYFDDCLTEAFIDSVTVPTGGAGTFDLNYHWTYGGETNPTLVKQYVTVTTPEGLVTNFSSNTSDNTMNVLSLDATNFTYPCSIEGDYTIQITLTLQADSSSAPLTVTATKTCTAIADDGKTFELTLDTEDAENLDTYGVPKYTVHCWYGGEEITDWPREVKIMRMQWATDTHGDFFDEITRYYPDVTNGDTVTFQADYQGKLATVTHTPTWK